MGVINICMVAQSGMSYELELNNVHNLHSMTLFRFSTLIYVTSKTFV